MKKLILVFIVFHFFAIGSMADNNKSSVGELLWKYELSPSINASKYSGIALYDSTVYLKSDDGNLYALNNNGELDWKFDTNGAYGSVCIGKDEVIYVGGYKFLYALNNSGRTLWRYETSYRIMGSPVISSDGTIYIRSSGRIHAINKNGSRKWMIDISYSSKSSNIVIDKLGNLFAPTTKGIIAIHNDGTTIWDFDSAKLATTAAIDNNNNLYFGNLDSCLYSIDSKGSLIWKYRTNEKISSAPVIGSNQTIYIGSQDSCLYAFNLTGTFKWKYKTSGKIDVSPTLGLDGIIYVGNNNGEVYAIYPNGELFWNYKTNNEITTPPNIDKNGIVYFENADNFLYALSSTSLGLDESPWPRTLCNSRNSGQTTLNIGENKVHPNFETEINSENSFKVHLFNNSSSNVIKYEWEFGDGSKSSEKEPVHIYKNTGEYLVKLKVSNNTNSDSVYKNINVGVNWKYHSYDIYGSVTLNANNNCLLNGYSSIIEINNEGERINSYKNEGEFNFTCASLDYQYVVACDRKSNINMFDYDGNLLWNYKIGMGSNNIESAPSIDNDGSVYVYGMEGSWGDYKYYLFKIKDGEEKWKYELENASDSSPVIDETGNVYIIDMNTFKVLNANGKLQWEYRGIVMDNNKSLAIDQSGNILLCTNKSIVELDPAGKLIWEYEGNENIYSSPSIDESGNIYFGSYDYHGNSFLNSVSEDGQLNWKYKTNGTPNTPAIAKDGSICFGAWYYLYVVNPNGTLKWKYKTNVAVSHANIADDGTVYIANTNPRFTYRGNLPYLYSFKTDNGGLAKSSWPCYQGYSDRSGKVNTNIGENAVEAIISYAENMITPNEVSFIDSSKGNNIEWYWDFGDGSSSINQHPKKTFDLPGEHTVMLKINNGYNKDSIYQVITTGIFTLPISNSRLPSLGKDGTLYIPTKDSSILALSEDGDLKWNYKSDGEVYSYLVISNDKQVIFMTSNDELINLNETGKEVFKYNIERFNYPNAALDLLGNIYVSGRNNLHIFNSSKELVDKIEGYYLLNEPSIGLDGTIYFSGKYELIAYDKNSKVKKWEFDIRKPADSPAIADDGTIYIGSNDEKYFYAINSDGSQKWRINTDGVIYSSPSIGPDGTIYYTTCSTLFALDTDGTQKWSFDLNSGNNYSITAAIAHNGTIYIGSWDNYFYALNPDGSLKWKFKGDSHMDFSPLISENGNIYTVSENGTLYSIPTSNGGLANYNWPCARANAMHTGGIDIVQTNTSIEEFELELNIYPNPTTGIVQIEGLLQNENTVISIFNVMGQKLEQKKINKHNSTIDLSSYKKGTYFLSFNNSFKSAVKIIKE